MIHIGGSKKVNKVYMLTVGWEKLPKSWSVYDCDPALYLIEPIPVVLIETLDGWVMLDTGLNKALIEDEALYRRFHSKFHHIEPFLPSYTRDPLLDALERIGLSADDIAVVALSHLHNDHAGGIRSFSESSKMVIQESELAFGLGNQAECEAHGFARIDYDDPTIDWTLIRGDAQVARGIDALFTPGHTPGHMSFVVHLDDEEPGGLVFAFDAADLMENIIEEKAIGGFVGVEAEETVAQIRKLKKVASRLSYTLIPGHDPEVWPTEKEGFIRRIH